MESPTCQLAGNAQIFKMFFNFLNDKVLNKQQL